MRTFESGATRNTEDGKLDYEGFLSPLVLEGYAAYMQKHRTQADGTMRESDNWQKGIPLDVYRKSLIRHVMTAWMNWRGHPVPPEQVGVSVRIPSELDTLYAILFNAMGMIHELRKPPEAPRQPVGPLPFVPYPGRTTGTILDKHLVPPVPPENLATYLYGTAVPTR